jgi:hypothetical protein
MTKFLFLNLFATAAQRNDLAVLSHDLIVILIRPNRTERFWREIILESFFCPSADHSSDMLLPFPDGRLWLGSLWPAGILSLDLTGSFKNDSGSNACIQISPYPTETALFKALPRLCRSSPMPRIVAHPSKAKTTKSNAERNNVFFFILLPGR